MKNKLIISYWIVILANISITVKTYKYLGLADGSLAALMRRSAICSNEVQQYRHRSTQLIHDLSSCLSLAMSNRLSSRRPSIWSEERTTCGSRGSMSSEGNQYFFMPVLCIFRVVFIILDIFSLEVLMSTTHDRLTKAFFYNYKH